MRLWSGRKLLKPFGGGAPKSSVDESSMSIRSMCRCRLCWRGPDHESGAASMAFFCKTVKSISTAGIVASVREQSQSHNGLAWSVELFRPPPGADFVVSRIVKLSLPDHTGATPCAESRSLAGRLRLQTASSQWHKELRVTVAMSVEIPNALVSPLSLNHTTLGPRAAPLAMPALLRLSNSIARTVLATQLA
jgi:hypothetical protein